MLWFTSDLHLGHENVLRFTRRPYATVAEMDAALIESINARVEPRDQLYILGDVSFRATHGHASELVRGIACRHIHLIRGNHDGAAWDADAAEGGLFETVRDYAEIRYQGRKLVLMHYPLLTWNGMYRGNIHLHGHIHSLGMGYNERNRVQGYFRYDVGVDANGYAPVSFKELLAFYKDAQVVTPRASDADLGIEHVYKEDDGSVAAGDPCTAEVEEG